MELKLGAEGSLSVRLAWLTALRLFVLTLFLVGASTLYFRGVSTEDFSSLLSLVTLAVAFTLAAIYAGFLRVGRALPLIANIQLITDQMVWSMVVYLTGGVTSGATSLYGLTCLSGAILLGVRGALVAAAAGGLVLLSVTASMIQGALPPPPDQTIEAYALHWGEAAYPFMVNIFAMGLVTALGSYLAERLRATGGRLAIATERAEQAERLAGLGRLAAGLAHEIRNPLGAIQGSIELLRTADSLDDEDRHLCGIIERETKRLNDLVSDMLNLSKRRPPELVACDLAAIAEDVVTLAKATGRGQEVDIRYEGVERAPVRADADQLRQVAWNLIRNAVQASPSQEEIVVSVASAEGRAVLSIKDRGHGIPPESRGKLFDAFYTTRSQGTGVGLALVKQIVDDHGFSIDVVSEEGEGTEFVVEMPLDDAPPEAPPSSGPS